MKVLIAISIHAPSRERPGAHPAPCRARHFNPRSLSGATGPSAVVCDWSRYFNPRSLAGATVYKDIFVKVVINFNPRSLAGATAWRMINRGISPTFQSTLPHGSDRVTEGLDRGRMTFQSSLPRGSDGKGIAGQNLIDISIHAPLRERQANVFATSGGDLFQSTLPRGSDQRQNRCTDSA